MEMATCRLCLSENEELLDVEDFREGLPISGKTTQIQDLNIITNKFQF